MSGRNGAKGRSQLLPSLLGVGLAAGTGGLPLAGSPPAPPLPGSFAELADLRSASRAKPWRTLQASGYDRGGGFYDSGNFLREEPGRRYVLLDAQGPGCIDRMWFTRKSLEEPWELQLFLDGETKPSVRQDLDELCSGKREPFLAPFVGMVNLARYSYVPIAWEKRCKAVLVPTAPPERYGYRENSAGQKIPHVYYQLTYRSLPAGTAVRRFRAALEPREQDARRRAERVWSAAGASPWEEVTPARDHLRYPFDQPIPARGQMELFNQSGRGVVTRLAIHVPEDVRAQDLRLEAFWDGATKPAISAPVGSFFAATDPKVQAHGLWSGSAKGWYYCHLPMPFRKALKVRLLSAVDRQVPVQAVLQLMDTAPGPDDLYLHARTYDHQPPLGKEDYRVLETSGRGHWVGLVMDRPGNMEGDDRFYVDGETQPSIHGTGTEDFFSFAWGFSHLANLPLHGITRNFGAPVLYRFHLPAAVPFRRSLRLTFEHGHGNEHQGRYSGVAFFYSDRPEGP